MVRLPRLVRTQIQEARKIAHPDLGVGQVEDSIALHHFQMPVEGLARNPDQHCKVFLADLQNALPILRQALMRHLWISYRTGFGQSVISVLGGVSVLLVLAGFVFWQINDAAHGGRYPGGAFSGYAAGIGLLLAESILVRRIEDDPVLRRQIEER